MKALLRVAELEPSEIFLDPFEIEQKFGEFLVQEFLGLTQNSIGALQKYKLIKSRKVQREVYRF